MTVHPTTGTVVGMTRPVLTYADATPEQIAEARAEARRKLAEAANRDPAERERGLAEFRARLNAAMGNTAE